MEEIYTHTTAAYSNFFQSNQDLSIYCYTGNYRQNHTSRVEIFAGFKICRNDMLNESGSSNSSSVRQIKKTIFPFHGVLVRPALDISPGASQQQRLGMELILESLLAVCGSYEHNFHSSETATVSK